MTDAAGDASAGELQREEWAEVLRLLGQALDLPADQHAAWLAALPPEASRLKPTLLRMLKERPALQSEAFLEGHAQPPELQVDDFSAGEFIGPYVLLRLLGHGGMADVWLAKRADAAHQRQVALKLPLATPGRQRRMAAGFLRECRVLSGLVHPNIAGVLDVGQDGDQPWLAMEFIDGRAIHDHCRDEALDVPARLQLFLQVLRAVQHAHGQGVIHRDIKPANVMVDRSGQVKLLDFGVAKLLIPPLTDTDDGSGADAPTLMNTLWNGRAMTLEYASPEQLAGGEVGTASDVYSLGALLFELLLGRRLYRRDATSPGALEQAILHDEAPRPSDLARSDPLVQLNGSTPRRLARRLAGDLDLIVTKALRKPPAQRYATVAAFAEDVERHLTQRPILARPESAAHQFSRFVARHRVGVAAGSVVTLALAVGIGMSLWQARQARLEGERAVAAMSFLTGLFENSARQGSGARPTYEVTGKELLEAGVKRLATEYREHTPLRLELLQMLGKVSEEMDLLDLAGPLQEEALVLAAELYGEGDVRHAQAMLMKAEVQVRSGQFEAATAQGRQALAAFGRLRRAPVESVAQTHILLGNTLDQMKLANESEAHLRQALDLLQRSGSTSDNRSRAAFYLARAFEMRNDFKGAEAQYLEGLAAARKNFGERSYIVAFGEENYGDVLRQMARFDEARQHLATALDIYSAVLGNQHLSVAGTRFYLGQVLAALGQRSEADAMYAQAISLSDAVAGPFHRNYGGRFTIDRAHLLLDMGRLAEAKVLYEAWLTHWLPGSAERMRLIRFVGLGYSRLLIENHALAQAERVLKEIETGLQGLPADHPNLWNQRSEWQARRAEALVAAGQAQSARALLAPLLQAPLKAPKGDFTGALALLTALSHSQPSPADAQAALQAFAALGDPSAYAATQAERQATLDHTLGRLTMLAGDARAARPRLASALALRERIDAPGSPWTRQAQRSLAECEAALKASKASATVASAGGG
ncbi:serine/threonine-protein kinase [Roseateles sp.]|uniref:serine/threonine-protein kinase n=1 Tax=Roseateles sp. TaxID=1971397 RepID=UPI0032671407